MAEVNLNKKMFVFRLRNIPNSVQKLEDVAQLISTAVAGISSSDIVVQSLATSLSQGPPTKVATLMFKSYPGFLGQDTTASAWSLVYDSPHKLFLDRNFLGLTPLNSIEQSSHKTDCIAISGLASHPFGSWQPKGQDKGFMWIRDRLPQALSGSRMIVYGYDSQLEESGSFQRVDDLARGFLQPLRQLRTTRNFIFLAHSLGGLILKSALAQLATSSNPVDQEILGKVMGAVCFGVPNLGMEQRHFLTIAKGSRNEALIHDIARISNYLTNLDETFTKDYRLSTVRFFWAYETRETSTTTRDKNGNLSRDGRKEILVDQASATCRTISENPEITFPINENHSNIVKFGPHSIHIDTVIDKLTLLSGNTQEVSISYQTVKATVAPDSVNEWPMAHPPQTLRAGREHHGAGAHENTSSFASIQAQQIVTQAEVTSEGLKKSEAFNNRVGSDHHRSEFGPFVRPGTRWLCDFSKNERFVGRQAELGQLCEILQGSNNSYQVAAIVGLGGVGKTQIALEYAFRWRKQSPDSFVFWIPAYEPSAFDHAFRLIGRLLQIPGIDEGNADVRALVKEHLSDERSGPWLMIVDNADYDDPSPSPATKMSMFRSIPSSRQGSTIITTRSRQLAAQNFGNKLVFVKTMTYDEAREMLRNHLLPQSDFDAANADKLVELLEFLPLAIIQAAAYMNAHDVPILDYIDFFNESEIEVVDILSNEFEDQGRYPGAKNAIATTWLISFNRIQRERPLATEYLSFMACLLHSSIPESVLPAAQSKILHREALGALTGHSFISKFTKDGLLYFDMHRLVYLATRNWLRKEERLPETISVAVQRLADIIPPGGYERRDVWSAYLPHAIHLLQSEILLNDQNKVMALSNNVGKCLYSNGQYAEAEQLYRQSLRLKTQSLGPEHEDTLQSMASLAEALVHMGEYDQAEKLHSQTLTSRKKVLGEKHRDVMVSMQYLGQVHARQGRFREAEQLHREAYHLRVEVLGLDDPSTLASKSYLAETLNEQGKYKEAETMHLEILQMRIRVLGMEYPATLASMSCLGVAQLNCAKFSEAEDTHRKVLKLRTVVLGVKHPHTLITKRWIADSLNCQGKYDDALMFNEEALVLQRDLLGSRHPDVLFTLNSVADSLAGKGRLTEAVATHRDAVDGRVASLGNKHPHTLQSKSNLANALYKHGERDEGISILQEVTESQLDILGLEHPDTRASIKKLDVMMKSFPAEQSAPR